MTRRQPPEKAPRIAQKYLSSLTDEGRYRLLVEAVTDYAIYMLDSTGIISSWNPGAQRFKGYTAEEIVGSHFSCFYTEEDKRAGLPARGLETSEREGKFESEGWRVRKDGTRFWAYVIIDPIRDPVGNLVGFAKVTRDLSDRKIVEENLKRSEEQFRLLVDGVTDYSIYMLSPEGIVTNWNAGAQRIKGFSSDEIVGQHFSRFYTDEDRAQGLPLRNLAIATREGRLESEGWRIRKDGTRFWANVVIDAVHDEDGKLIGFAKVTRDVTEKRDAQHALEQAREALFQSQKMEALGQLTGGIAHDFNNLLMVFLGSLELVRRRVGDDPKILSLLDNAILGAQRGASLTQRMLAFARRQDLHPETVNLPAMVQGMADLLRRSLGPSVAIDTRFPLALDAVHADNNQLELAVLNLAMNARDAMPAGGTIVIGACGEQVSAGHETNLAVGRYVRLWVADTGEGMDEATLARAREPFFTTKGVGKGTGLGLSMVHGVTEQSGGRLVLKSQPGRGTTAELWLPVSKVADAANDGIVDGAGNEPWQPSPMDRRITVLAVDDDELVLASTAAMLEDLGYEVLTAPSGARALEVLRQAEAIDLVITDQAMPRMTGVQLAEAIAAERPGLPIVLATGYAELPQGLGTSLVCLAKPFRQETLAHVVGEAILGAGIGAAEAPNDLSGPANPSR